MGISHNRSTLLLIQTFTNSISIQISILVLTLLPLLHAQSLCPVLQDPIYNPCTDVCIMDMKQTLDISGQYPDYRTYLKKNINSSTGCPTLVKAVSISSVGWSGNDMGYHWPWRPAGTQAWMLA